MSSSGRVPPEVLALMGQEIQVASTTPNTDIFGEGVPGPPRAVKCYLAPFDTVEQQATSYSVTPNWVAYCDDIDLVGTDKATVPDGTEVDVLNIETYFDEIGELYQVVTMV